MILAIASAPSSFLRDQAADRSCKTDRLDGGVRIIGLLCIALFGLLAGAERSSSACFHFGVAQGALEVGENYFKIIYKKRLDNFGRN